MSRPERVDDSFKATKLKSNQTAAIKDLLASLPNTSSVESRVAKVREHLRSKGIPFKGVRAESGPMGTMVAVHLENSSYSFAIVVKEA